MLYTLSDAVDFLKPFVKNGTCSAPTVVSRVNECQRRLLYRPENPVNTKRHVRFCIKNNTLTLPREIEKIISVDIDCAPREVFSMHYEFLTGGPGEVAMCNSGFCGDSDFVDMGDGWPTFFDIPSKEYDTTTMQDCEDVTTVPKYIIAFSTDAADTALTMHVQGRGSNNDVIMDGATPGITLPINQWSGGVEGTIDLNTVQLNYSSVQFVDISNIRKPVTAGYVSLYTYDPSDHRMYFLGKYHPDETVPGYRRYKVTNPSFTTAKSILALVALRYVPAKHDNDMLLVQNLDALKLMSMAIDRENERDFQEAKAYESDAVRLLTDQNTRNRTHQNEFQAIGPWGFSGINMR